MRLERCTAQHSDGSFCDVPTAEDMPFPICLHHAKQVFARLAITAGALLDEQATYHRARGRGAWTTSVVYYIAMGDRIKIGHTINLANRVAQLMATHLSLIHI